MGAWHEQTFGLGRILVFTTVNGMLAAPFPLMIGAPCYIMAVITLGAPMQTAQAFQVVVAALSWPVDNLAQLAEWRASAGRVLSLHADLGALGLMKTAGGESIRFERTKQQVLELDHLSIGEPRLPSTTVPVSVTIGSGSHVMLTGERQLIERLPHVIAGLWHWGGGRVTLPENAAVFFFPERPYLPIGTLLNVVCYPSAPDEHDAAAVRGALHRVGLDHLENRLEETALWEQVLTHAEVQLVGFARLLLQHPRCVAPEGAMTALDEPQREAILKRVRDQSAS